MAATNMIARHATENGWSIGINKTSQGYVCEVFEVARIAPGGKYLVMSHHRTEKLARAAANKLWLRDMGREVMIGAAVLAA
jgi:hypothetical protein